MSGPQLCRPPYSAVLKKGDMKRCFDFLGHEVANDSRDRVSVIPVPIEYSTSYIPGTVEGPEAILKASKQVELFNQELNLDLTNSGIVTLRHKIASKDDLLAFLAAHRSKLLETFPVFLGGEHSITPWILQGMKYDDIGIVWLDAHSDMREEYEGNAESHACAARNSVKFGPIVEIGIRSMSSGERKYLDSAGNVKVFGNWNAGARESIMDLPDKVYLSVDFDAFSPSLIRAVGTPEPGGLRWEHFIDIITFLFEKKQVVGMDAVELCPNKADEASNFIAAKAVYEAVSRYLITKG